MIKTGVRKMKKVEVLIKPGETIDQEDVQVQNIKQYHKQKSKSQEKEKEKVQPKKKKKTNKKQSVEDLEADIFDSDMEEQKENPEEKKQKASKKQKNGTQKEQKPTKKKQKTDRKMSQLSELSDMYQEEEEQQDIQESIEEEIKEKPKKKQTKKEQEKQKQAENKKKKEKTNKKEQKIQENQEIQIQEQKQRQKKQIYEETVAEKMGLTNQQNNKKKWQQKGSKTGKFTDEEVKTLQHAVCQYAKEKTMNEQDLLDFIQIPRSQANFGAWSKIAGYLPDRSVQSCHNFIKRKYNPLNYKGRWTEDEVTELLTLIEQHGRKWETIGKEIGRTAQNCRDKYKSLGEVNYKEREKLWTLEEMIKVMKYIEKKIKIKFINREVMEDYFTENPHKLTEKIEPQENRQRRSKYTQPDPYLLTLCNFIEYDKIKNHPFENINWTKIAEKLKTKSYVDCRNKWLNQLKACLLKDMGFNQKQDQRLIEQIKNQFVETEEQIDFNKIQNGKGPKDNKQRWQILKKRIIFEKLGCQKLEDTLRLLKQSFRNKKVKSLYTIKKEDEGLSSQENNSNVQVSSNHSSGKDGNSLLQLFKSDYRSDGEIDNEDSDDDERQQKKIEDDIEEEE